MDEQPASEFQKFLLDRYYAFVSKKTSWRNVPTETDFARYLGVSIASLSHWMLGTRVPDMKNSIILARRLGPKVFELLGYPELAELHDPKLKYIFYAWEALNDDTKREILSIVERGGVRPFEE